MSVLHRTHRRVLQTGQLATFLATLTFQSLAVLLLTYRLYEYHYRF